MLSVRVECIGIHAPKEGGTSRFETRKSIVGRKLKLIAKKKEKKELNSTEDSGRRGKERRRPGQPSDNASPHSFIVST